MHCEKNLFVLASHQKIPLPKLDNPAVHTGKFFPPPIDIFTFPHVRKLFGSLEGDLLHSQMPEKSVQVRLLEGDLAWRDQNFPHMAM
jgi:hypothetical protein